MSRIASSALFALFITLVLGVVAMTFPGGVDADGAVQASIFLPMALGSGVIGFALLGLAAVTGFFDS